MAEAAWISPPQYECVAGSKMREMGISRIGIHKLDTSLIPQK